jgi:hypothetical protein
VGLSALSIIGPAFPSAQPTHDCADELGRDGPSLRPGLKFYLFILAAPFFEIRQAVERLPNRPVAVYLLIVQKTYQRLCRPRNPLRFLSFPATHILDVRIQKFGETLLGKIELVAKEPKFLARYIFLFLHEPMTDCPVKALDVFNVNGLSPWRVNVGNAAVQIDVIEAASFVVIRFCSRDLLFCLSLCPFHCVPYQILIGL